MNIEELLHDVDSEEESLPMSMDSTREYAIKEIRDAYFENNNNNKKPAEMAAELYQIIRRRIVSHNAKYGKGQQDLKWRQISNLPTDLKAAIIIHTFPIISADLTMGVNGDKELNQLRVYANSDTARYMDHSLRDREGTYVELTKDILSAMIDEIGADPDNPAREVEKVMDRLQAQAPVMQRCGKATLVPVANGIYDLEKKELLPFTEDLVFLNKIPTAYRPDAPEIELDMTTGEDATDQNPDNRRWSWRRQIAAYELPDGGEILKNIAKAMMTPLAKFDKAFILFSEAGGTAKNTFIDLIRNCLFAPDACTAISLSMFTNDRFGLETLVGKDAILETEAAGGNSVVKCTEELKKQITHDTLKIYRKNKKSVDIRAVGSYLMALNERPRFSEKSPALMGRFVTVPFHKVFRDVEGVDCKLVNSKFIYDKRVHESMLKYLLETWKPMEVFPVPEFCKEVAEDFIENNDSVVEFWTEFKDAFVWDLLPFSFLFDLYVAWFAKAHGGSMMGLQKASSFKKRIMLIHDQNPNSEWEIYERRRIHSNARPGNRMDKPEPLIAEFNLKDWINPMHQDLRSIEYSCRPRLRARYEGLVRKGIEVCND